MIDYKDFESEAKDNVKKVRSVVKKIKNQLKVVAGDRAAFIGLIIIAGFFFVGIFGPYLAPHHPLRDYVMSNGEPMRLASPSLEAPMGTTPFGKDVLSQFLAGARPTLIAAIFGGISAAVIGFLIGLTAGYFGGLIDEVLMRITDMMFSLPSLPFALLILSFIDAGIWIIALIIAIFLWKDPARIIRPEVQTIKQRTFVKSARARGAGHLRTMFYHVCPNVLPIGFLYAAYAMAWAINFQAGLAFLGFGDSSTTSWGRMIRMAYDSGSIREAWWWVGPPVLAIILVTVSVFMVGRAYEEITNPKIKTETEGE